MVGFFFFFLLASRHNCIVLGGLDGKESTRNAGDLSLIPGLGKSPGEGHDNPLQLSCLENSIDRGAKELEMTGQLTLSLYRQNYPHMCSLQIESIF